MKYLSKKYGIKGISQVKFLRNTYKDFGEEGLLRRQKNENYSIQGRCDRVIFNNRDVLTRVCQSAFFYDCQLA